LDVKLINLDDFVILGPGSEWFWTMVSGVVLAVTFYAIYRQLSLQRGAAAIEQVRALSREWNDERMTRARLDALTGIRDGASPAATLIAGTEVADFWEDMAYLVRAGSMDRRRIYDSLGPSVRIWWGLLAPSAALAREEADDRGIWVDFEWLAAIFAEFDRKAGEPAQFDAAYLARRVPTMIETNEKALRSFEQLRAVIVQPATASTAAASVKTRKRGAVAATVGTIA
jgi:hypothetical protein